MLAENLFFGAAMDAIIFISCRFVGLKVCNSGSGLGLVDGQSLRSGGYGGQDFNG